MTKYTRAKKFNKTNIKDVAEAKPILYRFQNKAGDELYVGVAKKNRVQDRLQEHLSLDREKIPGAAKIKIAQFFSIEKAKKAEVRAIKEFKPRFNKQGK